MIYFIFYHIFKVVVKLRFKSINLNHTQFLSSKQPLIIVANHGNSFLDAILLAVIFKRKLHFLARADVFNTKFKRWFLGKLNMMPIYRIRDGREELKNNDLIFAKCTQILKNNGAILIFPEGNCVVEKRLRTFKTGFVNLAFESEVENLAILPISINYSSLRTLNTHVHIFFNDLIDLAELKQKNQEFLSFSKDLLNKTKLVIVQNMVQITQEDNISFYNQIYTLIRNNAIINESIRKQIEVGEYLDNLKLNTPNIFEDIKKLSGSYFEDLHLFKVDDLAVNKQFSDAQEIIYYSILPIYFLGKVLNILPSYLLNFIVNKKVKELQFKNPVKLVLSPFIYSISLFLLATFLGSLKGNVVLLFLLFVIFILVFAYSKNRLDIFTQLIFIKSKDLELLKNKRLKITQMLSH